MSWDLGVIRPVVIVIIGALVSGGVGASGYVVCVVRGPGGSIVHLVVVAPANLQTISSQRRENNGSLLAPRSSSKPLGKTDTQQPHANTTSPSRGFSQMTSHNVQLRLIAHLYKTHEECREQLQK